MLYTAMGAGCYSVVHTNTLDADCVAGVWNDGRICTFRGVRKGKLDFGVTVFGQNENVRLGTYQGYDALLIEILRLFQTGVAPVETAETFEIYVFITATDKSKEYNGERVLLSEFI